MIGSLFPTRQLYSPLHRFMIHRSHHLSRSESFTIDLIKHDAMALSTTASLFYMAFHLATAPTDKTFRTLCERRVAPLFTFKQPGCVRPGFRQLPLRCNTHPLEERMAVWFMSSEANIEGHRIL